MVNRRSGRDRHASRNHTPMFAVTAIAVVLSACMVLLFKTVIDNPRHDFGVVEIGDPFIVYWWKDSDRKFIQLKLRADATGTNAREYSQYTLSSLWKLGENSGSDVWQLNAVLGRMISLPVRWYIGPPGHALSNMPPSMRVFYEWHKRFSDRRRWLRFDMTGESWYTVRILADGTSRFTLNRGAYSGTVKDAFEIPAVRSERVRVAVINATTTSGLADEFSGMISGLGAYVGFTETRREKLEGCRLTGTADALDTATAASVRYLFGCRPVERKNDTPFDLEITVTADTYPFGPG